MKTSKEFTERLKAYLKVTNKSDSSVYEQIGMSYQTFYNKVKASNWTLQEYLDISNIFDSDKIKSTSIFEMMSKNIDQSNKESTRPSRKNAAKVESISEVDFLRDLVEKQAEIIKELSKTKN